MFFPSLLSRGEETGERIAAVKMEGEEAKSFNKSHNFPLKRDVRGLPENLMETKNDLQSKN